MRGGRDARVSMRSTKDVVEAGGVSKKKQKQKFNLLAVYVGAIMYTKVNKIHFTRCKPALSCFINSIQHSYGESSSCLRLSISQIDKRT